MLGQEETLFSQPEQKILEGKVSTNKSRQSLGYKVILCRLLKFDKKKMKGHVLSDMFTEVILKTTYSAAPV